MHRDQRWTVVVAAVLTFGTGALDVLVLARLGGVFASVMTGNLALMGLGLARADVATIVHTVLAFVGYVVGVAAGSAITGARAPDHPVWPRRVTAVLVVQLALLCALAVGWVMSGGAAVGGVQMALLATAAASMGLQGAAVRGLGVTLATTYLTGTLTGLIANRTLSKASRADTAGLAALIAAVVGAACGGLTLATVPVVAPVWCLVSVLAVIVLAEWRHRHAVDHASQ
ncbi:DUF1275 domain-containing protein [Mycobacterium yunnanensis]|uniref:DUF1275 domain-containing protein n=1 Tax=Mycobacterium yunnanensis TaxID=368477 RepID=A0A9X2YXQ9_9MYCO|nr:YoaK family protein [Mycobacterium yunnanensis]MCV7419531.1 DUF1275 domain-containing protein [Mycobacterium yunnanensis]